MQRTQYGMTGWGYFMQGAENQELIDKLGSRLSVLISCPCHYPAFGKRVFECKCGVLFPIYFLDGGDDDKILERHSRGPERLNGMNGG